MSPSALALISSVLLAGFPLAAQAQITSVYPSSDPNYDGSCDNQPRQDLRFGVSAEYDTAQHICCHQTHGAEYAGFHVQQQPGGQNRGNGPITVYADMEAAGAAGKGGPFTFYDSVCNLPLFRAPVGRTYEEFHAESIAHGWPSFRPEEAFLENIIIQPDGEMHSVCGTHLGHNLPDGHGDRYCIDLVCIAGKEPTACQAQAHADIAACAVANPVPADCADACTEKCSGSALSYDKQIASQCEACGGAVELGPGQLSQSDPKSWAYCHPPKYAAGAQCDILQCAEDGFSDRVPMEPPTSNTSSPASPTNVTVDQSLGPMTPETLRLLCDSYQGTTDNLRSMDVLTRVQARYAYTTASSVWYNPSDESTDASFRIQLPQTAFISNFTMMTTEKVSVAAVEDKESAEEKFRLAQQNGVTAGTVKQEKPERGLDVFSMSVNVAPNSCAFFVLTYEELLVRKKGRYEVALHVQPNALVDNMAFTVDIEEPEGLVGFEVHEPQPRQKGLPSIASLVDGIRRKVMKWLPTRDHQKLLAKEGKEDAGVNGDLKINYDVPREANAGTMVMDGCFFTHFFAPSGRDAAAKDIAFVIDISGSMGDAKMAQAREATIEMIKLLRPEDRFVVQAFDNQERFFVNTDNHTSYSWQDASLLYATPDNVQAAIVWAEDVLHADGGTNINSAIAATNELLYRDQLEDRPQVLFFLTDGQPSSGVTDPGTILQNIREQAPSQPTAVRKPVLITLGFGFNLNYELLQALAWDNGGSAFQVYEEDDGTQQIVDFYDQVNKPALLDVDFQYEKANPNPGAFGDTTQSKFPVLFVGAEAVVTGKTQFNQHTAAALKEDIAVGCVFPEDPSKAVKTYKDASLFDDSLDSVMVEPPSVCATQGGSQGVSLEDKHVGFMPRLFSYMKLQELIREKTMEYKDKDRMEALRLQIIELAIEHNFVTPETSMIMVDTEPTPTPKPAATTAPTPIATPMPTPLPHGEGGDGDVSQPMNIPSYVVDLPAGAPNEAWYHGAGTVSHGIAYYGANQFTSAAMVSGGQYSYGGSSMASGSSGQYSYVDVLLLPSGSPAPKPVPPPPLAAGGTCTLDVALANHQSGACPVAKCLIQDPCADGSQPPMLDILAKGEDDCCFLPCRFGPCPQATANGQTGEPIPIGIIVAAGGGCLLMTVVSIAILAWWFAKRRSNAAKRVIGGENEGHFRDQPEGEQDYAARNTILCDAEAVPQEDVDEEGD